MTTYKIGGCLPTNAPSYVERQADRDLARYLQQGGYCYVLTSRQMGKSSLKVRTKHKLELEGLACAEIDLTGIGAEGVSARQWYNSIADELACQFDLEEEFEEFLDARRDLSDARRLGKFIDEIVLAKIPDRIVIFVDEIDKVISLGDFTDDFFGLIRNLAERANNDSKYQRLSFVLLGVASPNDLIKNKERTPFNIGKAIALYGFQPTDDISPLMLGLQGIVPDPEETIADILYWTGGQPILTQKLCQLVVEFPHLALAEIITTKIVENWEIQDNPPHLTTIRDRITHPDRNPVYSLEQYRHIVTSDTGINIDDSQVQQWLKLSGLVVERQQKLVAYNPIYARVFDRKWVDRKLAKVCPYAPALTDWLDAGKPDRLLLRGTALEEAIHWRESRWQQYQTIGIQNNIFVEKSAAKRTDLRLEQTKKQIKKLAKIISVIVIVGFIGGLILSTDNLNSSAINKFDEVSNRAVEQYEFTPIESLKLAIVNADNFDKRRWTLFGRDTPTPKLAIQKIVDKIHELDEINTYQQGINAISFCKNGNIFSAGNDGAVKLWNRQRQQQSKPKSIVERPETIFQSLHFKDPIDCRGQFATGSSDGDIRLWDFDSDRNSASLKFELKGAHAAKDRDGGVQSVRITNDGKYLISTGRADGTLQKWQIGADDRLISAWPKAKLAHAGGVVSLNLNGDGKTIGTGGKDGSAKIWNLDDGVLIHTLKGHNKAVNSVYFCSAIATNCRYEIATGSSDGTVKLWTKDGNLAKTISAHIGEVRIVRFSLDGKLLATASANDPTIPSGSSVRIWELDSSQLIAEFKGHHGGIESLRFNPEQLPNDRQELVTSGREDSTIRVWKIPEPLKSSDRHGRILSVRFDPQNSQYFFTAGKEGEIKRWHLDDKIPKLKETYSLGKNVDITSIRLNPNRGDRSIAVGDSNGKIALLELIGNNLQKVSDFDTGQGRIASIDWSYKQYNDRTARYLLATTGSQGKDIKLWEIDVDKNQKLAEKSLPLHQEKYTDLTIRFSEDGRYLAAAGKEGKWMLIEDFNSSKSIANIHHFNFDRAFKDKMLVRFSSNSKSIALVGQEGNIWHSQLDLDKIQKISDSDLHPIPTYQAGTENAAIGRNDRAIATAGSGSAIRLWDWQGRQIADFRGGWGNIKSIDFSKDGKYILAGGDDGIPRVWRVDRDIPTLIEQGCNWLNQGYLQSHQSDRRNDEIYKICKR